MDSERILDAFFKMLKDIIESITLPTGKGLFPAFFCSLTITLVSILVRVLHYVALIDWRGALMSTIALGIIICIERRGFNEVSRMYRTAYSHVANIAKRAKRSSSNGENARVDEANT